jgi:predicted Rossmann fold nucleotide-binding protein DprA/Smf involved in DNA uptake
MTDMEKKIVDLIAEKPLQVDNISRELNLTVPEIMEFLLALELKGITREISGKRFMLTEDYV